VTVRWLTAFLDLPADRFVPAVDFWTAVTATTVSATRGERGEFATLVPADGDAYLRVQRVDDGPGGIHLDLHVDDVDATAGRAATLGATPIGGVALTSPAGLRFCLVRHRGESVRPEGGLGRVDQVCIDVPAARDDGERAFWAALTGWEHRAGALAEFTYLERPAAMPLRLLLQRLGPDDPGTAARAHLDLACGARIDETVAAHELLGASFVRRGARWTTMADPAGLPYCLTARDPVTGTLAG
jgi:hypothetical protein